ncbi:MAG: BatD family protein, partial [Gammaproteobacteria bacterium]|nr:BatD family protein [Gammaproteobacteria bacterium]
MPHLLLRHVIAALLLALSFGAQAQTRAWLDRDRIASGETATLNIQTDQPAASAPDYAPLLADFELSGNTSRREFEIVNGVSRTRLLFAVALQPRREGVIAIPGLRVGSRVTQSLTLTVTPAAIAPRRGGVVFIEAEADDQDPWVQQAVGYVVRLYYAVPLISGQLDQDAPDGATLQRVGEDLQY